jgi:ABC-type nitrate/sulfonate/bicarbonate transport system substrate-binding protein
MNTHRWWLACALAALCTASLTAPAPAAEPLKIRAAWIATPPSLLPILFPQPGIAKHQGKTYDLEAIHFNSSPTEITALAAGEIELATLNFASFPIAVVNAKMTDLRIICDETQDGYDGYVTNQYMVLKDSPIKRVEDLKGKMLAVIGIGAGSDIGMRAGLAKHGLFYPRDYNVIEVRLPSMKPELMEHKVDLAAFLPPFLYDPELQRVARTVLTMKEGMGGSELSVWVMRAEFLAKHRAAVVDLLEDTVRSYRWFADPANHRAAITALAAVFKQPPERFDWAFTKKDNYRDPDGLPNIPMMQRNVDVVHQLGFLKSTIDVAHYADLSLVKEAAARIK